MVSLYILDTDILSLYQHGHADVCRRVVAQPPGAVAVTVISLEEQLTGWYTLLRRSRRSDELVIAYQSLSDLVRFFAHIPIVSLTEPAIARFLQLKALRRNVAAMALRIAAIVLEAGGILVTRNRRDFGRIPGLTSEDWSLPGP